MPMARLLPAIAAALVLFGLAASPAQADIDLTGTWKFSFVAPIIGVECPDAQVVQTGSDVDIDCSAYVSTFDKSTRVLSGSFCPGFLIGCVSFAGTVSPDGNSVSGVWRHSGIPIEFTFSGTRKDSQLPTPSPVPPPVGGIAFEADVSALELQATGGTARDEVVWPLAVAGVVALSGAAWCVRRRFLR